MLTGMGHRVTVGQELGDQSYDLLIALHARRSHGAALRFKERHPSRPLVVVLTGTDVYGDIHTDAGARESLDLADRLVSLQPLAIRELPSHVQPKLRPIIQSAHPTPGPGPSPKSRTFDVCVVGHLREVKDPFRTAFAAQRLSASSRVRVLHLGGALSPEMARQAEQEASRNPRYHWLGELPHWRTRRIMKRSRLLAHTSLAEGGANVISEAVVDGLPVVASAIPGNVGLLGEGYPGYFDSESTAGLTELLVRAETDPDFMSALQAGCAVLEPHARPEAEQEGWRRLVEELAD